MERLGIVDLLTLATTLAFALPIGVYGLQLLIDGRTLFGLVGVAVAVGLVVVERVLWTPDDVPVRLGRRLVRRVVGTPDDEADR
ncbi:MAG: DUF7533 family protein [Halanaeroarchaeum sp.]